jgi:hypothetical protein
MTMRKTDGLWSSVNNSWQYTTIYDANGVPICRLDLEDWDVNEENQAAREAEQAEVAALIVAAPGLLQVLRLLVDTLDAEEMGEGVPAKDWAASWHSIHEMAREAVTRAAGAKSS